MATISPFSHPLYVMTKPAGALCNLKCQYCYYLEKANLYKNDTRHIMSDELLERFIKQYIDSQSMNEIMFCWHGGETLMRPLSFYEKVVKLQQQYGGGRHIENIIQTNGTLLDAQWAQFFHKNHWLVGVSIDGPQTFHDKYRRSRSGKPSWYSVMKGIDVLNKYQVDWNAMAVVNNFNADYPLEFYHFFKDIGCRYLQFTPIVERFLESNTEQHLASITDYTLCNLAHFSVSPSQWGNFLCTIFDEWVQNDVGQIFIQLFDTTLANWVGVPGSLCTMAKTCGHAGVMEHNGDVYSCDHFVFPAYKLGNISQQTLTEMMYSERQQQFGKDKYLLLPKQCKECRFLFACNGECPKNRFSKTVQGESGLNYLCSGYYRFFEHIAPYMDFMKNELAHQRPPANIMEAIKKGQVMLP